MLAGHTVSACGQRYVCTYVVAELVSKLLVQQDLSNPDHSESAMFSIPAILSLVAPVANHM